MRQGEEARAPSSCGRACSTRLKTKDDCSVDDCTVYCSALESGWTEIDPFGIRWNVNVKVVVSSKK